MVQSPSWKANWFAASQEILRISRNPKAHYRTHKRPPPVSILGQPNPVHVPTSHLLEIRSNIIHPSMPRSPHWSLSFRFPHQDPIHPPLFTHTRHMPCPSHSSRFYHSHNIGWGVKILPTINTYLTGSLGVSTLLYFHGHFGIFSSNWIWGSEIECQWVWYTCTDQVPPLWRLQDLPLTHTITYISSSLSVYFRASFTLQVLRLALIFLSVAIRVNLFHLNAFLYDYVTVLVFYLVSSSCAYISLGVFGICAAATLRRWMFVAVSIPNAKQLLWDTDG